MPKTGTKTLVFLTNAPEPVAYRRMLEEGARLVALDPATMDALDAGGTPYRILEDDMVEELVELGEENFRETDRFCATLDAYLTDHSEAVRSLGLSFARNLYYELKLLRDAVSLRLHALSRTVETEEPSAARLVDGGLGATGAGLAGLPLYRGLIPAVAALSVPAEVTTAGSVSPRPRESFSLKRLGRALLGESAYRALSVRAGAGLGRGRRPPRGGAAVLLVDMGADLAPLLRLWAAEGGHRVIWWDGAGRPVSLVPWSLRGRDLGVGRDRKAAFRSEADNVWATLGSEAWFQDFFSYRGVSGYPVVEPHLRSLVTQTLPDLLATSLGAQRLFEDDRPALVLTSALVSGPRRTVAQAARRHGIPVAAFQHGGAYGYCRFPMHLYTDLTGADHFGAYGPSVQGYLRGQGAPEGASAAEVTAVGSPALEALSARTGRASASHAKYGLDPAKRTVVYAPTNFSANGAYLPGTYPDTLYYRLQTAIVDVFARHGDVQVLIKLAPGSWAPSPLPERVRRLGLAHVTIVERGRFTDLLSLADALVIDWPTTVLLEGLTTDLPIALLADRRVVSIDEPAAALLERAVRYSEDAARFPFGVDALLSGSIHVAKDQLEARREFLEGYGGTDSASGIANDAARWLERIIAGEATSPPRQAEHPMPAGARD